MFEDRNGQLLRLAKGTQAIAKQLATLVGVNTALSVLYKRVKPQSPAEFVLCKLNSVHFGKVSAHNGTVFHGPPCRTSAAVKAALAGFFQTVDDVTVYKKVTVGSETFSSTLCTNQSRRSNFTVMWGVGEQTTFTLVHGSAKWGSQLFLVINKLHEHNEQRVASPRIVPVRPSAHLNVVPAPRNMTKSLGALDFVCISPNSFEMNL